MNKVQNRKGFTLIELLIVITIIGILAVAFLPTLLGAPAKGRDAARISAVEKISTAIAHYDLENPGPFPTASGPIEVGRDAWTGGDDWDVFEPKLGGELPSDPADGNVAFAAGVCNAADTYHYLPAGATGTAGTTGDGYSYGIISRVELEENANTTCASPCAGNGLADPTGAAETDLCYAVLIE